MENVKSAPSVNWHSLADKLSGCYPPAQYKPPLSDCQENSGKPAADSVGFSFLLNSSSNIYSQISGPTKKTPSLNLASLENKHFLNAKKNHCFCPVIIVAQYFNVPHKNDFQMWSWHVLKFR